MASASDELFAAIDADDPERVRAVLATDPGLATSRDGDGVSALMRARYRSDEAVIAVVASSVDRLDVFEAAAFGDLDRLAQLVNGEPLLATSYAGDGFTPLHLAAYFGQRDAAGFLIDHGADVDAPGRGWMTGTALHAAAAARRPEVVAMLLEAGAAPDARQSHGWTPLHSSVKNGDLESVDALIAAGADVTATSDDGDSVRDLARAGGDGAVLAAVDRALS